MTTDDIVRHIDIALFGVLAAVTGRQWLRQRLRSQLWATLALSCIALSNVSFALPETNRWAWSEQLGIALLLLFPYLVLRFSAAFGEPRHQASSRIAGVVTAGLIAWHLVLPPLPDDVDRWPTWLVPWVASVLVAWTVLSMTAAIRLWRAGSGQSTLVRNRLRTLAVAIVGMAAGVLIVGVAPQVAGDALVAMTTLSGVFFYLGLAPPGWLRAIWRRREQQALQEASERLVAATSRQEIVDSFMPHAAAIVGANACALLDRDGDVLATHDVAADEIDPAAGSPSDGVTRVESSFGTLLIWTSPYAPLFGDDDMAQLRSLASLVQVALERVTLLEGQVRLAAIVDSSDDAILSKTTSGEITSWNPGAEKLYGYPASEAIGRPISMLIPPDRRGEEQMILDHVNRGMPLEHYETQRLRKDGQVIDVSVTVSPLRDGRGTIVGASAIARDVSAQKQAERMLAEANAELQRADRLKTEFLAMASHELRTPLTAIAGFTSTLLDLGDRITEEQRHEFLGIIDRQTKRLQRLVDDLLTLSRIESGALQAHPQQVDIPVAVKQVIHELGATDVTVSCEPEQLTARADPDHLEQILTNYVGNAVKYGSPPIEIDVRGATDAVEIRVRDHGTGVPQQFVPKLFERFQRAATHAEAEGTGLGLSIVRGLAHAQGGDAWYEPNRPTGSSFCVRLPTSAATTTERRRSTGDRRVQAPGLGNLD